MQTIGQNIKKLRDEQRVTQEALAAKLGLTFQAVSKWETGVTAPDIAMLPRIAEFFGVTIDELFKPNMSAYPNLANRYMSEFEHYPTDENYERATREFMKLYNAGSADDHDIMYYAYTLEHRARGVAETAETFYREAIEKGKGDKSHTKYYQSRLQLYQLLAWLGRGSEAVTDAQAAVEAEPDDPENHDALIFAYIEERDYNNARTVCEAALERFPDNYWLIERLGNIEMASGNAKAALKLYDEALAFGNPRVLFSKREALVAVGRYREAVEIGMEIVANYERWGYPIEAQSQREYAERIRKRYVDEAPIAEE